MYDTNNPLSAKSYTNKDFNSIYVELLETAKRLSAKWDPTISNESDPGVVLLKLDAIIGDKNNYNIDKNVLENYPETYTQEMSARSQYSQLGYKMPWYRAATTDITISLKDRTLREGDTLTIPKFMTVCDKDSSKIFTTTQEAEMSYALSGRPVVTVPVIQGQLTTLSIFGDEVITLDYLDEYNRIYVSDDRIAENGIIITSRDINNTEWTQVKNLLLEPLDSTYYEFGVDPLSNNPYIEFPQDIAKLIGSGLTIKYIVTDGEQGNVAAKTLTNVFDSVTLEIKRASEQEGDENSVSPENLVIYNTTSATNGTNPEGLYDAYRSFKRTVTTFDTLVTLRDYINAIRASGLVSNAVATDRRTDPQCSYKVIDKESSQVINEYIYTTSEEGNVKFVKCNSSDFTKYGEVFRPSYKNGSFTFARCAYKPDGFDEKFSEYYYRVQIGDMEAYDLKLYLLKSADILETVEAYDDTFTPVVKVGDTGTDRVMSSVTGYIEGTKSVQHNYADTVENIPFMFQAVYPLNIKWVPMYKLSQSEVLTINTKITKDLMKAVQSKEMDFGTEPSYDIIYDTVMASDDRIKFVILDDFVFTPYAVYWDGEATTFKYVPIGDLTTAPNVIYRDYFTNDDNDIRKQGLVQAVKFLSSISGISPTRYLYVCPAPVDESEESDPSNLIAYKCVEKLNTDNRKYEYVLETYSDKIPEIRRAVIAKSVLAGVTPLYDINDQYDINLSMKVIPEMSGEEISVISTGLSLYPFGKDINYSAQDIQANLTLAEGESMRFLAPSFVTDKQFSNYIKYILYLKSPTGELQYEYADGTSESKRPAIIDEFGLKNFYVADGPGFKLLESPYMYKLISSTDPDKLQQYLDSATATNTGWLSYNTTTGKIVANENSSERTKWWLEQTLFWQWSSGKYERCGIEYEAEVIANLQYNNSSITFKAQSDRVWPSNSYYGVMEIGLQEGSRAYYDWTHDDLILYVPRGSYTIPANTEYQLRQGDAIYFFYRTEDGDTIPYTVEKYEEVYNASTGDPTIIKANFEINASHGTDFPLSSKVELDNALKQSSSIPYSNSPGSLFQQVLSKLYGEYDLSGTKQLDMRKVNSVDVLAKDRRKYYFITKDVDTDADDKNKLVYRMKMTLAAKSEKKDSVTYEYLLGPDEYFLYTNTEVTEYEALGEGTLVHLILDKAPDEGKSDYDEEYTLTVGYTSFEDIAINGIDKLKDNLIQDVPNKGFKLIEQQMYNFIGGEELIFRMSSSFGTEFETCLPTDSTPTDENGVSVVTLDSTIGLRAYKEDAMQEETIGADEFVSDIYFYKEQTDPEFIYRYENTSSQPKGWYQYLPIPDISKFNDFLSSDGEEGKLTVYKLKTTDCFYWIVGPNDVADAEQDQISIKDYLRDGSVAIMKMANYQYPVFKSDRIDTVRGYSVSYYSEDGAVTKLPQIDLADDIYNWKVRTNLNLNISKDNPQEIVGERWSARRPGDSKKYLISDQGIKINGVKFPYNKSDYTEGAPLDEAEEPDNSRPLYLQSTTDVLSVGGDNTDVTYLSVVGKRTPVSILTYQLNKDFDSAKWSYAQDNSLVYEDDFQGSTKQKDVTIRGLYLDAGQNGNSIKYILPVKNYDTNILVRLMGEFPGEESAKPISRVDRADSNEAGYGISYFRIPSNIRNLIITFIPNIYLGSTQKFSVVFGTLMKYTDRTDFMTKYGITAESIEEEILKLDHYGKFKYDYIPPSGESILDPLEGKSFLETNHIFNHVTIPKAELKFMKEYGSSLEVANNR